MDGVGNVARTGGGMMAAAAVVALIESIVGGYLTNGFDKLYYSYIKKSSIFSIFQHVIPSAQAEENEESEYSSKNVEGEG